MNIYDTTNKWDSDSDEDINDYQNEESPPELDKVFINDILKIKQDLYDNIVFSPELGTTEAQNVNILNKYLNNINTLYILSIKAQKGNVNIRELDTFPEKSREQILNILNWITNFFSTNSVQDVIPYSDYIRKSFHEYQFVQKNSFE